MSALVVVVPRILAGFQPQCTYLALASWHGVPRNRNAPLTERGVCPNPPNRTSRVQPGLLEGPPQPEERHAMQPKLVGVGVVEVTLGRDELHHAEHRLGGGFGGGHRLVDELNEQV